MCLFIVLVLVVLQPQKHRRFVAPGMGARVMSKGEGQKYLIRQDPSCIDPVNAPALGWKW
jgi:hypothetical protein